MREEKTNSAPHLDENCSKLDWDLVLRRIRKFLLDEKELPRAERLIEREAIWQRLPPEKAVEWAEIALAMGKHEVGMRVLEWVLHSHPHYTPAWEAKTRLLESLIARSLKEAKHADRFRDGNDFYDKILEKDISRSFEELRLQEKHIDHYMTIFRGREDGFARQWVDKERGVHGYVPVRRPMSKQDVLDHLRGRHTYGIYLLHNDDTVSLGVIDVDCRSDFLKGKISSEDRKLFKQEHAYLIRRLVEMANNHGIPCFIEFSGGKGYHFWFSFEEPIQASIVRKALIPIARVISNDLTCFKLEVFPKQDKATGKGFGNLVKLPLGVHRVTGKASFFIHEEDRKIEAQLAWLLKAPRIKRGAVERLANDRDGSTVIHPRDEEWAGTYPELAVLSSRCNVLGQIIYSCRSGKTLSVREEKVLLGTLSFLRRSRLIIHSLLRNLPDYNPHLVDYKISRVRGTPLGCKTIHRLLDIVGDFCIFEGLSSSYAHPLLHLPEWENEAGESSPVSGRINNLQDALNFLRAAILAVERFLPKGGGKE